MTRRPIIFLDVDGVVNTPRSWGKWAWGDDMKPPVEPELVLRLQRLVFIADAEIVVHSSWRSVVGLDAFVAAFGEWFRERVGQPWATEPGDKARSIERYLDEHLMDRSWPHVILDDEQMGKHLVQTSSQHGLQAKHVQRALDMLGVTEQLLAADSEADSTADTPPRKG